MLKPLNKNIVLKKEEVENKTASGIILTTETKSLPPVGAAATIPGTLRAISVFTSSTIAFAYGLLRSFMTSVMI